MDFYITVLTDKKTDSLRYPLTLGFNEVTTLAKIRSDYLKEHSQFSNTELKDEKCLIGINEEYCLNHVSLYGENTIMYRDVIKDAISQIQENSYIIIAERDDTPYKEAFMNVVGFCVKINYDQAKDLAFNCNYFESDYIITHHLPHETIANAIDTDSVISSFTGNACFRYVAKIDVDKIIADIKQDSGC